MIRKRRSARIVANTAISSFYACLAEFHGTRAQRQNYLAVLRELRQTRGPSPYFDISRVTLPADRAVFLNPRTLQDVVLWGEEGTAR
jgi:hypothetical protein